MDQNLWLGSRIIAWHTSAVRAPVVRNIGGDGGGGGKGGGGGGRGGGLGGLGQMNSSAAAAHSPATNSQRRYRSEPGPPSSKDTKASSQAAASLLRAKHQSGCSSARRLVNPAAQAHGGGSGGEGGGGGIEGLWSGGGGSCETDRAVGESRNSGSGTAVTSGCAADGTLMKSRLPPLVNARAVSKSSATALAAIVYRKPARELLGTALSTAEAPARPSSQLPAPSLLAIRAYFLDLRPPVGLCCGGGVLAAVMPTG